MQEKIYKASLLKQIMVVIRKTLITVWAVFLIVNIVENIVCEHLLHMHLGYYYYWKQYLMFFTPIVLGYFNNRV